MLDEQGHPAPTLSPQPRRHAVLDAGRADDLGPAGLDEDGTLGVHQVVRGDTGGTELL